MQGVSKSPKHLTKHSVKCGAKRGDPNSKGQNALPYVDPSS